MAARLGTAVLYLNGDDSNLQSKLGGVQNHVKGAFGGLGGFVSNALAFATGGAILNGIQNITGGIVNLGKSFVTEAINAEKGQAQLNAVIASTGGAAGMTAKAITSYSDTMSTLIPLEDDVITGGQSLLLTFTNIGKDIFPGATQAAMDMAFAMSNGATPSAEDLQSKVTLVGKALNDPIAGMSALSRVGIQFTDAQKEQIKTLVESGDTMGAQTLILAELEKKFGGSALAAGQTFGGQMEIMENQLGNVKEQIGTALLPALTTLAQTFGPIMVAALQKFGDFLANTIMPAVTNVVNWFVANWPQIQATATAVFSQIQAVIGPIIGVLVGLFQQAGDKTTWLGQTWTQISGIITTAATLIQTIVTTVFNAIRDFVTTHGTEIQTIMSTVWTTIQTTITNLLTVIQGVINLAMSLIKGDWQGAWDAIQAIVGAVFEQLKTIISAAFTVIDTLTGGALTRFGQKLGGMATSVRETLGKALLWLTDKVITPVSDALQKMSDIIEGIIDAIKRLLEKLPSLGGVQGLLGGLLGGGNNAAGQGFGGGGLQLAPVGVAGGMGGGNTFNVTVNALGGDVQAVQQAVRFGVLDAARAMGVR